MADVKEAPKAKTQNGPEQTKDILPRTSTAPLRSNGSPFTMMRRFAREMDHLFDDFGLESGWHLPKFLARGRELLGREAGFIPAEWSPRIDVLERDGQFTVRADLPGMSKDDIKVEILDGLLTIQGERTNEKKEEREGYSYSECSYGSFYRTIPLPEGADASKATADFRNGVLEVTVPAPARAESKARQVEVRETK
jgi:HSP20 family protein